MDSNNEGNGTTCHILNNPEPMILVLRARMQTLYRTIALKST